MATWFDAVVSSPGSGDVIVQTDTMTEGLRAFVVSVHSTLPCTFEVQQYDGSSVTHKQKFSVVSGEYDFQLPSQIPVFFNDGDRLRIVSTQALSLGTVGASIWIQ